MTEAQRLASCPALRAADMATAWASVAAHPEEIDEQIRRNEEVQALAFRDTDENFPLPVVASRIAEAWDTTSSRPQTPAKPARVSPILLYSASLTRSVARC
jgi:hypothetical protein